MAIASGAVPLRQLVAEAAQEIGYKPTSNTGWQAALDKIAKPAGAVPTGNGMVQRNTAATVKRPAPMMKGAIPLAQRFTDAGATPLPPSVVIAKKAAQGGR